MNQSLSRKTLNFMISLALVIAPVSPAVRAQSAACSYDFTAVTNLARNAVKSTLLDGASLLLIRDGQVIYEKYFGSYNASTAVFIASASKWLAGATLMTLVDERKLSLNDPVSKYLSYFTGTKGTMTIRQMFSHTSGLPGINNDSPCLGNPFITMDACVREIAQANLIGSPGAQFAYGENSMQAAGRVCEVVSGKSWESLFQERLARPLGMTSTTFTISPNPIVAGSARTTLSDYAIFLQMLLNDGLYKSQRILSASAVQQMQQDLTAGIPVSNSPYGNLPAHYGIGEWLDLQDASGKAIQLSSQGAFGFSPWIDKRRNLTGVFLVQNSLQNVYATVAQIQQKVREIVDACPRAVACVSAASYSSSALAPEAITAAFGTSLATTTLAASSSPLPTTLSGTAVKVKDSAGVERFAPLFFISPSQINYQIPPQTATGAATVTMTSGDGSVSAGTIQIQATAPGLFSADSSGQGLAAAVALRVKADGTQSYEPMTRFDTIQNKLVAIPLDPGPASDQVFVLLFGTGLRHRSALSNVTAKIGGTDAQVLFAGAQGGFVGLDQVNLLLPRSLTGRGEADVGLSVDGKIANTVRLNIQ